MEIVKEKGEEQLIDLLEFVQDEPELWMGIHFSISQIHQLTLAKEGLSEALLENIRSMGLELADKMYRYGLESAEGRIFIMEDGDVVALFMKKGDLEHQVSERLKNEFNTKGTERLLTTYSMADKFHDILAVSEEKRHSAKDYALKKKAVKKAQTIFDDYAPDPELTRLIQNKRFTREGSCILIIEDDLLTRGLVTSALKKDHAVAQAKNAQEGIVSYIDHAPDMVLLDIHIPIASGHEVLRAIRVLDPKAYVVMLSGDSVEKNVLDTTKNGASGFIRKPLSKDKLLHYIDKCPTINMEKKLSDLRWQKLPPGMGKKS